MATFEATFESSANFEADFQVEMSGGGDITVEALSVTANGTYTAQSGSAYNPVEVDVEPNLQYKTAMVTPSLTPQTKVYTADSGYDGLSQVDVNITAIPQGTEGTPTASKGSVSNHSVSVTPSVTNTTGYIEGGTKTGTAVTVSASELVSGTKSVTANGTEDVTNYASVNVNVANSYSASDEGKVVDNGALVSQSSDTVTQNGTVDTTLINSLTVNVSGGGVSLLDVVKRIEPSGAVVLDDTSDFNIRSYFFQGYTGITSFSSNKAKELHGYAFQNCSNMTSVNCPNCTKLEASVFEGCSKLASITLSNSYSVAANCFRACTSLVDFDFWGNGTSNTMFYGDSNLEKLDCKNLKLYDLRTNCFQNCTKLNVLIIRKTSDVVGLANINAFSGTPFANGGTGGTLYVPQSLLSSYQSATNWSTILGYANNNIQKIEGSIYE